MKKWENPQMKDLNLAFTEEAWGTGYICTVCCKTSNKDKNQNNAKHFHKGFCPHHPKNNGNDWADSLSTVVANTEEAYTMCKSWHES